MAHFAGLDWGGSRHAVCVIDAAGTVLARFEAGHDAAGLAEMLARLRRIAPASDLPVAIERPSGLVVDALIEAGHPVVPIHPSVVRACRPRYSAAGGKSDPGDALMLADIPRTDRHRFRPLAPLSGEIRALRALVRGRDDLVGQRVAVANTLRSTLESVWPGAAAIFAELGNVRERFPTAGQLAAEAGVAPVTHASGKSRGVTFRWACNHRLRQAITTFADNSRHASSWAASLHRSARDRGCEHQHATRILARAWCRMLWKAWQDHTTYDPARHNAANEITA